MSYRLYVAYIATRTYAIAMVLFDVGILIAR